MPQCNFAILDHYKSDLASDNFPCLLLLNIDSDNRNGHFMVFITAQIGSLLNEISNQQRIWMLGVLLDLSNHQLKLGPMGNIEFEQFCSLGVGPLRTFAHGTIYFSSSNNLLDLICESLQIQDRGGTSKYDPCFLHSFKEFHSDTLRPFDLVVPRQCCQDV